MQQCTVVMLNVDLTILSIFNFFPDFNVPEKLTLIPGFARSFGLVVQRDRSSVKIRPKNKMPTQTELAP